MPYRYPSDPTGLCGYNCRHTFYPFWPGLSVPAEKPPEPQPKTWNGVTYDYYDATQEQRRREREIRAMKREASAYEAAGSTEKAKEVSSALRQKSAEYREFSEAMDISAKPNRLRVVDGYGKQGYNVSDWYLNNVAGANEGAYIKATNDAQQASKITGRIRKPEYPVGIDNYEFDAKHANKKHDVTREEALSYIKDALFCTYNDTWGSFNFYSENGAAYVQNSKHLIRTAFSKEQYDDRTRQTVEMITEWMKTRK